MARKHTILIADDEKNTREGLRWSLEDRGKYDVLTAADGAEALGLIGSREIHLLITDLKMPEMDGMELLLKTREQSPDTAVVILTGHGTVEGAVDAIKQGAFDYLIKPVNLDELNLLVERALLQRDLIVENEELREALEERHGFDQIIGSSEKMQRLFQRVRQVAPTRASVLLVGESGTGKELIAGAIHYHSPRRDQRFIRLNCGALTPTLLESELFGHEAGAFTDARKQRQGRFELADGGTIFLDEITETSPEFQVKLLRVLQEREFERVGGTETIQVDVRIIAATNQDIDQMVREGRFREDLFYRLNVVRIEVPPLRDRVDDIPLLAQHFLVESCRMNEKPTMSFSPKALNALRSYSWPGNVRQLQNAIEGAVVLSTGKTIGINDLPEEIGATTMSQPRMQVQVGSTVAEMERQLILATLEQTGGNRAAAARMLGLGRKTLYRKLQEYGVQHTGHGDSQEEQGEED